MISGTHTLGYFIALIFLLGSGGGCGVSSRSEGGEVILRDSDSGVTLRDSDGVIVPCSDRVANPLNVNAQKIYDLTQVEFDLKFAPILKLELVEESAGSRNFYFKLKSVHQYYYNFPHKSGKDDFLIYLGLLAIISIENRTNFDIEIYSQLGDFDNVITKAIIPSKGSKQLDFGNRKDAQESILAMSSYIKLLGKVMDGIGSNVIPIVVKSGPIFQVKISENLASDQSLFYHSNIDKYTFNGNPLDISDGELDFWNDVYPILHIVNDTPISRKITFYTKSKSDYFLLADKYGDELYVRINKDPTGLYESFYTFELAPNQEEFLSFEQVSDLSPTDEKADATMKIETSGELPVSIDLLEFF